MISKKRVQLLVNKVKHLGKQVECPICASTFNFFAPYGLKKRDNALCTHCGSLERHRLLWLYLKERTEFFSKPMSLLHVAPEKVICERVQKMKEITYYPCDLEPDKYPFIKMIKADITHLEFDDNFFDVVFCNHVLEHVPDDAKAISELRRILKPGGWAILQVPIDHSKATTYEDFSITDPRERERVFGQDDHVRVYGRDYIERLRSAGFQVKADSWASTFSSRDQFKYGLDKNEIIYYCTK